MHISWHDSTWRQHFGDGRSIPQSLLLCGSAGAGLDQFADTLAQAAVCSQLDQSGAPCGACVDCQWALNRRHPDLLWLGEGGEVDESVADAPVELDEKPGKASSRRLISVTEVRELISFFQTTPHRERARVAVLNPAESMNLAAANALLKLLEEPPNQGHLILVCRSPARLPATIRSRCRTLRLPRPDTSTALAWLKEAGVPSPELALAQTGGAPLAARDLAASYWEARSALLPTLARGADCSVAGPEAELSHVIPLMQTWCFDLAAVRCGAEPRYHPDFRSALGRLGPRIGPAGLTKLENQLRASRRWLDHPMNPKLVVESLLIAYAQAFEET